MKPSFATVASAQATPLPSLLPLVVFSAAIVMSLLARDWIAGAAVLVLWAGWYYLWPEVGPPVLPLAFSYQWTQVVAGVFYYAFTGRQVRAMFTADYRPMVLIGLGCLVALLAGLRAGMRLLRVKPVGHVTFPALSWPALIQVYVASVVLTGFLRKLAWQIPQLTQPIIILTFAHFGLLFLIFRRLCRPPIRWGWFATVLTGEVLLGFTGYFAEFREALVVAALALLETFDRRRFAHWLSLTLMAALLFSLGLLWMSVKTEYRGELRRGAFSSSRLDRLERIGALTSQWLETDLASLRGNIDSLVQRLWAVYYPALAMRRVPAVLPHSHGTILWAAIRHVVMPRLLFPNKAAPPSDSQLVRRYSGVWVAGPEQGTSIAFGYAAESYVDFGVPLMFLPIFFYGLLMGVVYHGFFRVIRQREFAVAVVSVIFWLSLYLFERSWLKTLGLSGTLIIYLGGVVILVDRYLDKTERVSPRRRTGAERVSAE
ncbi:MAG: hypothetical protein ACE5I7_14205 [Candidatus Binatia bacterium]